MLRDSVVRACVSRSVGSDSGAVLGSVGRSNREQIPLVRLRVACGPIPGRQEMRCVAGMQQASSERLADIILLSHPHYRCSKDSCKEKCLVAWVNTAAGEEDGDWLPNHSRSYLCSG